MQTHLLISFLFKYCGIIIVYGGPVLVRATVTKGSANIKFGNSFHKFHMSYAQV
jgi:hypothetical protein